MHDQTRETVFSTTDSRFAPYGGALAHHVPVPQKAGANLPVRQAGGQAAGLGLHHDAGGLHHDAGGLHHDAGGVYHDDRGVYHDDRGVYHDDRGVYHDDRGVYHDDRGVYHGVRGLYHGVRGLYHDNFRCPCFSNILKINIITTPRYKLGSCLPGFIE